MQAFLAWLVKLILEYLAGKAATAIQDHVTELERDKAAGIVDSKNIQAYEQARDRAERIKAATELLNGDNP